MTGNHRGKSKIGSYAGSPKSNVDNSVFLSNLIEKDLSNQEVTDERVQQDNLSNMKRFVYNQL